ncbi:MAG: ABC transporter ATP-binding protein [Thermoplasmata archaeon]|nr:MAG: ABC transporter ATP-binding protein [Thermoplasmata archaeon]
MNEKNRTNPGNRKGHDTLQKQAEGRKPKEKTPLIEVKHLQKVFTVGQMKVKALGEVSFVIQQGEFIALQGASGAGKSTLLQLLGGLEQPSSGSIRISGTKLHGMSEDELARFRKENVGFVFQFFNLIPTLTALENVMVSRMFDPESEVEAAWDYAVELLTRMALEKRMSHRPSELSGGEQQRVAIARALLNRPKLLLADEPTGNVDSGSGKHIMELFKKENRTGTTIILATHNSEIASYANRIMKMKDGRIM